MAWKELSGQRRIEDANPSHIDYIITFQDTAGAETIPTMGDLIGAITSGTLPNTGLDAEPRAVQISEVTKATTTVARVTVRFRGWYVE